MADDRAPPNPYELIDRLGEWVDKLARQVNELQKRPVAANQVSKAEFDALKSGLEKRLKVIETSVLPPPNP